MVRQQMDWLELDITYVCGMNCHNCNRMTGIAPGQLQVVKWTLAGRCVPCVAGKQ